eukprot:4696159-Alexandrium_andersonii.AAC.1
MIGVSMTNIIICEIMTVMRATVTLASAPTRMTAVWLIPVKVGGVGDDAGGRGGDDAVAL